MSEKPWTIGYKESEKSSIKKMIVWVDEVSPKEHYLYLYNVEMKEQEVADDENVIELEEVAIAKVVGFFNPTAWVYAVNEIAFESGPDSEDNQDTEKDQ